MRRTEAIPRACGVDAKRLVNPNSEKKVDPRACGADLHGVEAGEPVVGGSSRMWVDAAEGRHDP